MAQAVFDKFWQLNSWSLDACAAHVRFRQKRPRPQKRNGTPRARRPRGDGRDQVGGVELAPRVGPDRIAEFLGVEAVQRS